MTQGGCRKWGSAATAERLLASVSASRFISRGTQDNLMSANSLTRRPAFTHRSLRCSGWSVPVAVDSVDYECRVGEEPDSIDPVTAGQLKTGNESFVLRFMMVPSPSDPLRYLISITVLMVLQHDFDCCRTRGSLLRRYPAVDLEDVEPPLRRGILPRLHPWL